MNRLSRHELKYLQQIRRRVGANLSKLDCVIACTGTLIGETLVHGSPQTPHQPGGLLNISANDFKFLVSAGFVSPVVRVPHYRGLYYSDILFVELEHFAGVDGGSN